MGEQAQGYLPRLHCNLGWVLRSFTGARAVDRACRPRGHLWDRACYAKGNPCEWGRTSLIVGAPHPEKPPGAVSSSPPVDCCASSVLCCIALPVLLCDRQAVRRWRPWGAGWPRSTAGDARSCLGSLASLFAPCPTRLPPRLICHPQQCDGLHHLQPGLILLALFRQQAGGKETFCDSKNRQAVITR